MSCHLKKPVAWAPVEVFADQEQVVHELARPSRPTVSWKPKCFGFKRSVRSALMGAGALLHPILVPRPSNPALHDALAFQEDQRAVAKDFHAAIEAFEITAKSSSRSEQEAPLDEKDADDSTGHA